MSREVKVIGTRRNLAVERDGNLVILTIRCSSYYEAIELYDNSCKALSETGTLELRVEAAAAASAANAIMWREAARCAREERAAIALALRAARDEQPVTGSSAATERGETSVPVSPFSPVAPEGDENRGILHCRQCGDLRVEDFEAGRCKVGDPDCRMARVHEQPASPRDAAEHPEPSASLGGPDAGRGEPSQLPVAIAVDAADSTASLGDGEDAGGRQQPLPRHPLQPASPDNLGERPAEPASGDGGRQGEPSIDDLDREIEEAEQTYRDTGFDGVIGATVASLKEKRSERAKALYANAMPGQKAVTRAALLPENVIFRLWAVPVEIGGRNRTAGVGAAAQFIRKACGISSRKELATNPEALRMFLAMEARYLADTNQIAEMRG